MSAMPNTMKLGMAAAFVGAIVAFVSMAMLWDGNIDTAPSVGIAMATAMIFFAVAGSFTSYSPVKGSTVLVLSAIAIGFSIIAGVYGSVSILAAIILIALGAVCVFCANLDTTKDYVDTNRMI